MDVSWVAPRRLLSFEWGLMRGFVGFRRLYKGFVMVELWLPYLGVLGLQVSWRLFGQVSGDADMSRKV